MKFADVVIVAAAVAVGIMNAVIKLSAVREIEKNRGEK